MANKLIVVASGKKQAGKSSLGKFIMKEYLNSKIGKNRFSIEKSGKETLFIDTFSNNTSIPVDYPNSQSTKLSEAYSVKIYSFADPLKKFCIDVLGLDPIQCYGSDDDKNSATHISWDDMFDDVRVKYSRNRRGSGDLKPASGYMTAREVMQTVGTDIFRRLDSNCWARGLYSTIKNEGYELAIVTDARFPNEVTIGTENDAKVVRLTRQSSDKDQHPSENALDNFPMGEYSLVIDNSNKTMTETHKHLKEFLYEWFAQKKLIG